MNFYLWTITIILTVVFILLLIYFILNFMTSVTGLLEFILLQLILLKFLYYIKILAWYYLMYTLFACLINLGVLSFTYIMLKPESKIDLYVYTLAYLKNLNRIHPKFSYFFEYSIIWNFMYVLEVTSRLILIAPVIRSTLVFYNVLKWLFEKKSNITNEIFFFFLQLFFLNFFLI